MKQQPTTEEQQSERLVILEPAPGGSAEALAAILLKIALYTLEEDRVQSTNQPS